MSGEVMLIGSIVELLAPYINKFRELFQFENRFQEKLVNFRSALLSIQADQIKEFFSHLSLL